MALGGVFEDPGKPNNAVQTSCCDAVGETFEANIASSDFPRLLGWFYGWPAKTHTFFADPPGEPSMLPNGPDIHDWYIIATLPRQSQQQNALLTIPP
jgi:hypothetical protein